MSSSFDSGHTDMIHDTQLDYYGRKLATCSSDRLVKIFELAGEARHHIADLAGHEGPVRSWLRNERGGAGTLASRRRSSAA